MPHNRIGSLQTMLARAASASAASRHPHLHTSCLRATHSLLMARSSPSDGNANSRIDNVVGGWRNNNFGARRYSIHGTSGNNIGTNVVASAKATSKDMTDTYAVAVLTSNKDGNTQLTTKNLSIQQIVREIPGTHARDFFSLSLTSLGDASRKQRALMNNNYSVKNAIHPWFVLPRESEIVVSSCFAPASSFCVLFGNIAITYRLFSHSL